MPIDSDQFRDTMRLFSSGVTIVTIKAGEQTHGLTVAAFVSVSAEPPLISVVINASNHGHSLLMQEGAVFAVNILSAQHQALSDRFAWKHEDRFAEGNWGTAVTGAPILQDALAWLDCTVHAKQSAGTHTIFIGEVQQSYVDTSEQKPLVYWDRSYRQLAS